MFSKQMSKFLTEISWRILANRGKCLADVFQQRCSGKLTRTLGSNNSVSANILRLPTNRQRATCKGHDPGVSYGTSGRAFCTRTRHNFGQFLDSDNLLSNHENVDAQKSEDHPENDVEFPAHGSLEGADNSTNSWTIASTFSKEGEDRKNGERFWKYGQPRRTETMYGRRNYVVCYDNNMKIPVWVAECLTYECLSGPANRRRSRYLPDLSVRVQARASNEDYCNSGHLSRGHMAAAANNKHDQDSMNETFLLTNILPQDRIINQGPWNHLERLVRRLTDHYEQVRVISGPLLLPSTFHNGRVFVNYELIGESRVVVPTHLFKIVLADGILQHSVLSAVGRNPLLLVFIVPNSSKDLEASLDRLERYLYLERYLSTLECVEEKSGFEFFPELDKNEVLQTNELRNILRKVFV